MRRIFGNFRQILAQIDQVISQALFTFPALFVTEFTESTIIYHHGFVFAKIFRRTCSQKIVQIFRFQEGISIADDLQFIADIEILIIFIPGRADIEIGDQFFHSGNNHFFGGTFTPNSFGILTINGKDGIDDARAVFAGGIEHQIRLIKIDRLHGSIVLFFQLHCLNEDLSSIIVFHARA